MYEVALFDCAGRYREWYCADFDAALNVARGAQTKWPDKHVCVFNNEKCDYDTNGLTEEEQEALDE